MRTFLSRKFPLLDSDGVAYAVCGMATDITDRKRLEEALSAAALAVSQSEEETLYRQLARYLVDDPRRRWRFHRHADAGRRRRRCTMLAFHLDGDVRENFTYPLAGTPCETVVGQTASACTRARLGGAVPARRRLSAKLGLESYAGHPLADARGRPLGLIAVVSRQPLERHGVRRVDAADLRGAGQCRARARGGAQQALRASEANYRQIFEATRRRDLRARLGHGRDPRRQPAGLRDLRLHARGIAARSRVAISCGRAAVHGGRRHCAGSSRRSAKAACSFEWHRRNRDGSLHWDEVRLKAREIGGQPRILAFTREITERKEAEEALRASEEQYRAIFNASTDALVLWNSRSERRRRQPRLRAVVRLPPRRGALGSARARPAGRSTGSSRRAIITRTLAGERYHGEIETVRRSGERFPIEVRDDPDPAPGRAARARDDPRPDGAQTRRAGARSSSRRSCARRRRWRRSAS